MRKLLTIVCVFCALAVSAQNTQPNWVQNPPSANGKNFYYKVTSADGTDINSAYSKAFAMAILEASWRVGVEVDTQNDLQTLENYVSDNIAVAKQTTRLKINKVCMWYQEDVKRSDGKLRLYVLWQIARSLDKDPEFEDFNKCDEVKKYF